MKSRFIVTLVIATVTAIGAPAVFAQEPNMDPSSLGTTGLFTVPVAAVIGPGEFSVAASYSAIAHEAGDSSVETFGIAGSFVLPAVENLEIFVAIEPRVGVERDYQVQTSLGIPPELASAFAPRLDRHPFATNAWSDSFGDTRIGAKYRFFGEDDEYTGVAALVNIKLPTSSTDDGIGTGEFDAGIGVVASAEGGEVVGVSGMAGFTYRGDPDEFNVSNTFDYGIGVQVPTRFWISGIFEATGSVATGSSSPVAVPLGPVPDPRVAGDDLIVLLGGFRISHESGFSLDAAYTYNANFDLPGGLEDLPVREDGFLARIGYTSSRREPVVFMGAAPMALPPVNRPPTITCRAERTSVRVGESVRLFATVNDPDGDDITVTWNTQAGTLTPRQGETVTWSSQGVRPGSGPITARASDGYGGDADCGLTITVNAPPPPPQPTILTFMCAEFPSGNTRIDNRCKAILDDVALQLRQNPRATAVVTGHSDSRGAADVNDRMSQERADNAEAYLVDTHGIVGSRIQTESAGSSQPVGDNETAEGRLQNRRIVVVVTIPGQ